MELTAVGRPPTQVRFAPADKNSEQQFRSSGGNLIHIGPRRLKAEAKAAVVDQ
jgi:hypothetical protein